jgi:hypothetical protein
METSVPGLVINKVFSPAYSPGADLGLWSITHSRSGYAVVHGLPNQDIARLTVEWLGRQDIDWTQVEADAVHKDERIRPIVQDLMDAVAEVRNAIGDLAELIDCRAG